MIRRHFYSSNWLLLKYCADSMNESSCLLFTMFVGVSYVVMIVERCFSLILSLAVHSFTKYRARVCYLTFLGIRCFCSNRSVALATKAEECQCCQEIDRCGEVMEPADNTEGVNFFRHYFLCKFWSSNLY